MPKATPAADFTATLRVPRKPMEVYDAIRHVRDWWIGDIEGSALKVGDTFTYEYKPYHRTVQKVIELVPGKRIVWKVLESEIHFVEDKGEWKDTTMVFDLAEKAGEAEVRFTHVGLTPKLECFEGCSSGWQHYVDISLRSLLTTGTGVDPRF